jgi:hypothetical protein
VLPFSRRIISQNLSKSCSAVLPSSRRFTSAGKSSYAARMSLNSVPPSATRLRNGMRIPYSTLAKATVRL